MMHRLLVHSIIVLVLSLQSVRAQALTVYVDPVNGNDSNIGAIDTPFKTIEKGLTAIGAGGIVYLRGGLYVRGSSKLSLSKTGQAGNPIRIWAYPGERPVIDCSANTADGISISGKYYHLKGIEEMNAGHNGINISGDNNIIENCFVHDNKNTGLHLTGSAAPGPSNNLILNCDAYLNYDPPIGGNADGFSAKWTVGPGNVFRGCRSYNNSDDGWDLWMGTSPVLIDSCIAFRNGVDSWHSGSFDGNGNGFKLGGNYIPTPHIVRNCLSFDNAGNGGRGFDENNNTAGQTLYNCTAFRNKGDNYHFMNTLTQGEHVIKNCISYLGTVNISSGTRMADSWQGFTVSAADFLSTDTTGAAAARNADGSLPLSNFMRLAPSSPLIDAGVDVGIPYRGNAPDLGAFESGATVAGIVDLHPQMRSFRLQQNYPNPFNPSTSVSYVLSVRSYVTLKVYTELGAEVALLVQREQPAGAYEIQWDPLNMSSGIYYCRLEADGSVETRKMILIK